jgi:hypothetical protein
MADPKDKKDELDAVTAAYESISAKLEELRKQQAKEESQESRVKSQGKEADSSVDADEDDEAIAEIDIDSEEEVEVTVKSKKSPEKDEEAAEAMEPLPGTEDDEPAAKKQVYQSDDPLDDESSQDEVADSRKLKAESSEEDPFEDESEKPVLAPRHIKPPLPDDEEDEVPSLSERGAEIMAETDEMEKWEKMKTSAPEEEEAEEPKPTYQPLSQEDFQNRLRRPEDKIDNNDTTDDRRQTTDDSDEPNTLEDLADQPLEAPREMTGYQSSIKRPTSVDSLEDDWDIRRLRPQHRSMPEEEQFDEIPQREFRRSQPQDEENYFERRNQPLPRKRASIWHLFILVLIGVGVISATVYFLKYQFNEPSKPTPSPEISSSTPTPTPTPTPKPMVEDRASYRVRVLNGTSQTGLAAKIMAQLKEDGYLTDRAGNADNNDYEQTIIKVKEGTQSAALINTVMEDLGSEYSPISETTLKTSDRADVEIILGQK